MTIDEKLDEALKETFPASDAFWLEQYFDVPRATAEKSPSANGGEQADRSS